MSDVDRAPGAPAPTATAAAPGPYADVGAGWVAYAGVMVSLAGVMNVIYGIAAIDRSSFFAQDAQYILSDLRTWGWVLLGVGVVQVLVAFGIWFRNQFARWLGVVSAGGSAIVALLFLPAHQWGAVALFILNLLVIWGLVVHGSREAGRL